MIIASVCGTKPVKIEWFTCIGVVFLFLFGACVEGLRIIRRDREKKSCRTMGRVLRNSGPRAS